MALSLLLRGEAVSESEPAPHRHSGSWNGIWRRKVLEREKSAYIQKLRKRHKRKRQEGKRERVREKETEN